MAFYTLTCLACGDEFQPLENLFCDQCGVAFYRSSLRRSVFRRRVTRKRAVRRPAVRFAPDYVVHDASPIYGVIPAGPSDYAGYVQYCISGRRAC
jgi:hypothetical protein